MELSTWTQDDLEALAKVYIKHRQLQRAAAVRSELSARLNNNSEEGTETAGLVRLIDDLDVSNVVSLRSKVAQALFGSKRQTA